MNTGQTLHTWLAQKPRLLPLLAFAAALSTTSTLAQSASVCPVTPPAAQRWSDPATWGGALPAVGAAVVIPAGRTIALDIAPPPLASLTVEGTLLVDADKDVALTANTIVVVGGRFNIGSVAKPYTRKAVITLTGSDPTQNLSGMGTKLLGAMMGGKIEIVGEERVWWTQLNATAVKGASQITLKEAVDWRAGDRIVIASTALDPSQAEERVVTAVNGATITLNQPLVYSHFGQLQTFAGKSLDARAEVALLTRNIVIQGDDSSVASKFGGHVMIMGASAATRETNPALRSSAKLRGIELRRMGQFDRLGRYPIHWHQNGDSSGDFAAGLSLNSNLQRGIVVHGTDNVTVQSNVVYNSIGHSYGLEDGTESGNLFQANLGLGTKPFPVKATNPVQAAQNDDQAATFWTKAPNNRFLLNTAAGGEDAAYWFDDIGTVDTTKFLFKGNVAHSYLIDGKRNGDLCCSFEKAALWFTGDGYDKPYRGPFPVSELTLYKNRVAMWGNPLSLGQGFADVRLSNSIIADNLMGLNSHGAKDTVIVGTSANTDVIDSIGAQGIQEYGHSQRLENVTFVNFPAGSAIAHRNCQREAGNVTALNVKLVNAKINMCQYNTYLNNDIAISDVNGSIIGNGVPVTLTSLSNVAKAMFTTDCTVNNAIGARVCNGLLGYANLHQRGSNASLTRDDNVTLDAADVDNYPFYWTTIEGRRYTLNGDVALQPTIEFTTFTKYEDDDKSRATIVKFAATSAFAITGKEEGWFSPSDRNGTNAVPQVSSLATLEASTATAWFYDAAARMIHLKIWSGGVNRVFVDRR